MINIKGHGIQYYHNKTFKHVDQELANINSKFNKFTSYISSIYTESLN